jgi:uncharacterized protein
MPYKSGDVPGGTEKVPPHGQAIYRSAFNAAYEKYGEERAHAVAWQAVKRKFKKKGDRWVSKDGDEIMARMSRTKVEDGDNLSDAKPKNNGNGDDDDEDDDEDNGWGDARTVRFTDSDNVLIIDKSHRRTKDGYFVCDARIARTGIQLYSGDEIGMPNLKVVRVYRPPEEVFSKASMQSLAHKPITLMHPPVMVDSNNWDEYAVGHIGDEVTRDGDCVRVPLVIMDAKAIAAYEQHGVKELSVGYSTDLKWGRGKTPSGEIYDAKQTAIRGNHLAVVPAARGGSRLRIGDDQDKGDTAMPVKLLVDGHGIEFGDELAAKHVQDFIAKLQAQLEDAKKNGNGNGGDDADEIEEAEKKKRQETDAALASQKGEIAALKKQLEDALAKSDQKAIDAAVKDKIDLLLKASAAMDGKADFDGKDAAEIRRTVVLAKMGDAAKDLTDAEMVGAFKAVTANIKPRTGVDRLTDNLSLLNLGGGSSENNPKAIKDAAYEEYVKSQTNAWRSPPRSQ